MSRATGAGVRKPVLIAVQSAALKVSQVSERETGPVLQCGSLSDCDVSCSTDPGREAERRAPADGNARPSGRRRRQRL